MATNLRSCLRRLVFGRRTAGDWPRRRSGGAKLRCFRRLVAESLEPRTLLSSVWTAVSSGCQPLVDIAFRENPGTAGDEVIHLSLDESGHLAYSFLVAAWAWDPACDAYSDGPPHPPINHIGHISIETSGGSDRLILDFAHGSPLPVEGLAFHAWEDPAESDVVELIAYDVASLEVLPTGAETGTVRLETGPQLSFSQTEALVLGGTAADLLIDLSHTGIPGGDVVVANHATPGFSALDGATLPLTQFANPTGGLTIALQASGASRADTIHIEGLDAGFDADLTINGDSADAVNFQTNPTDLGPSSRNLNVTAGTLNIGQALTVSGSVGLHAAGDIAVQASGSLSASGSGAALLAGGDVILEGDVHSGRGHLTIMAEDDVVQNAGLSSDGGTMLVSASNAVADTVRGIAMQPGTAITSGGGNIRLAAAGEGDLLLGLLDAGAGAVSLVAERDILDNNGGGWLNVLAAGLRLEADSNANRTGQIGQPDPGGPPQTNPSAMDTRVTTLAATSADGIYVLESDGLRVDAIAVSVQRVNSDGSTTTLIDGPLADLETTDAGAIAVLSTTGTLEVNDGDGDGVGILANASGDVWLEARAEPLLMLAPSPLPAVVDGSFFTIARQFAGTVLQQAVFEFDDNGVRRIPGSFLISFHPGSGPEPIAQAIVAQIERADIGVFPRYLGAGAVQLGSQAELVVDVQAPNLMLVTGADGVAEGDARLAADVRSSGGHLRIAGGDGVRQDANLVTGDAGTVSVTARAGSIAMADGATTTSVHGPITYSATADVCLSVLTSTDGAIRLTADSDGDHAGSITETTSAEDANLVTRATVTLTASSGIGTFADGDIDTAVSSLEAINQSTGDVVIQEAAGLIVGGRGVQTAGPGSRIHLDVDAGELTVAATLAAGTAGEVTLAAGGPLVLEPSARVQTAGGEVRLQSDGAISMAQGSLIAAGGGDVFLQSAYGVLVGRIVSPGATITIAAGQGGIADGADPADPPDPDGADVEAETAVLTAAGSIGSRAEDTPWGTVLVRLDTRLHCLDAVSENGVGIFLVNEGPLEIRRAVAGREDLPLGIVDIATTSPLTVAGTVRGAVVNLTAAEGPDGATPDDNLTLRAGALVAAAPGTLTLGAGHELLVEPGATATAAAGILLELGEADPDPLARLDVNGDGVVTPLDALLVIGDLQQHGSRRLTALTAELLARDVNRDACLSPLDVLHIIAHLNRPVSGQPRTI